MGTECVETREDGEEESLIDAQFCAHPSKLDFEAVVAEAVKKFKAQFLMTIGDKDIALK